MDLFTVKVQLKRFIKDEIIRNSSLEITDDEPLITGGLIDSQSIIQIAVFIEDTFHVVIPDTDLTVENMDTVSQMAERILSEIRR